MLPARRCLLASFLLGLVLAVPAHGAAPPQPTYAPAFVDGLTFEWDLPNDFFTYMYRAGNPAKPIESRAYVRYDCLTATLYVLVLNEPGHVGYIDSTAQTSWVAIGTQTNKVVTENSGNDGIPADFAWVGRGYDGDLQHVLGFEASFPLAQGSYTIITHIDIWDAYGQTSASPGFPGMGPELTVVCAPVPTRPATWGGIKQLYR